MKSTIKNIAIDWMNLCSNEIIDPASYLSMCRKLNSLFIRNKRVFLILLIRFYCITNRNYHAIILNVISSGINSGWMKRLNTFCKKKKLKIISCAIRNPQAFKHDTKIIFIGIVSECQLLYIFFWIGEWRTMI